MDYSSVAFFAFVAGLLIASILWFAICLIPIRLYKELSIGYDNLYEEYRELKKQLREYESKRTKKVSQRSIK